MENIIGRQIDQYRIDALLGEGGMGAVYRALDIKLARVVALKIMHSQLAKDAEFQQRFIQEARQALAIIQYYRMNDQCFWGRPDPSLEYWLVNNSSPVGPYSGEDCISFNPDTIEVTTISGRWKIVDGRHILLDFADIEDEARKSFAIIQFYGFNNICFVGRPDASMICFRR